MDPRRVVSPRGAKATTGSTLAEERGESLFREFQRVALALSAERDVTRLLELIVTKCREVTTADAGSLYLVEQEPAMPLRSGAAVGQALRFVVAQNDSKPLDLKTTTLALNRASIAGYVALTRTPLNLADVYSLPPTVEFSFNPRMDQTFDYRTVSMLVVPMVDHSDEIVGVVQLINKKRSPAVRLDTAQVAVSEAQPFGPRDEEMATALASLAAVAIQGRRAERTRAELEDEIRQLQKMDAVGRLAGGVAHDFNNLLMVVRGRSELLLHHIMHENPMRRHIELIQQTAERAVALTQQLLTFSRKQMLQPRVIDLNAVVAGVEQMLRRLIGEHLEMALVVGSGLGRVRADAGQLEQVIMNLVVNARDAMPEGGRLTLETANVELDETFVRAHMGARAGSYVMLAVSDTGVGMDAATQAHLFEPFFTTKGPGKGTGLGLATVYGVVKQHGGYITVESAPGRGAVFSVYLPRTDEGIERPAPSASDIRPTRGSETVLLVEDEQSVRDLIREMLLARGYRVLEARHGAEALLIAERHTGPIHLLLTDVVMPQMGGREVAQRLRPSRPEMKALFISGYTGVANTFDDTDLGAVLLPKPFTADALALKLREVLDG